MPKYVNFTVQSVIIQYVRFVFPLVSMNSTNKLTYQNMLKIKKEKFKTIFKNWKKQFFLNIKRLQKASQVKSLLLLKTLKR